MSKEYLVDNLSIKDIIEFTDEMLKVERDKKSEKNKVNLLKIIPAAAAFVFVIGLMNFTGVFSIISSDKIPDSYIIVNGKLIDINETHLELDSSQITNADIEPLKYMVNLQSLWIISKTLTPGEDYYLPGNISDIGPIVGLKNLTELDLTGNQISDISALAGLTNLKKLYLLDLDISQINDISLLTGLTNLSLAGNKIDDISALAGLTNLERLNLRDTQVNDISVLTRLTNLIYLDLFNDQISDISALAGLTNLTFLNLGNNKINEISSLSGLTNLTNLALTNNQISDINKLKELKNLKSLDLRLNPIINGQIEKLREALPITQILSD